jgi:hypothetical protein
LQQPGQRVDVLLNQRGLLLQALGQPLAGNRQQRNQILGLVLGVLIQIEEQGAFFIGPAPDAMAGQELRIAQTLVAAPVLVAYATPRQELAYPAQYRSRPDQMSPGQPDHAVEIAPHVEIRPPARSQRQHEVRAHQVQYRCVAQPGRRKYGLASLFTHQSLCHLRLQH